jgi:hypothetical protein
VIETIAHHRIKEGAAYGTIIARRLEASLAAQAENAPAR